MIWNKSNVIDVAIRAGLSRTIDFRAIQHTFILVDGAFKEVPCSKGDIFKSKLLSLGDKRALMKFINSIVNPTEQDLKELEDIKDTPLVQLLEQRKYSKNLRSFILYAIAFAESDQEDTESIKVTVHEGVQRIGKYIDSLGKFGYNSPWLFPIFGMADILQAFCRLSAVYNGIFILGRSAQQINLSKEENICKGIVCTKGQDISCKYLVSNSLYLPNYSKETDEFMSRGIVVTNKSFVHQESSDSFVLGIIPPKALGNKNSIYLLQCDESVSMSPKGKFIVHLWTAGYDKSQDDLKNVVDTFFTSDTQRDDLPHNLLNFFFSKHFKEGIQDKPSNVIVTNDVNFSLDMDDYFKEAESIFRSMFPEEEFIPQVPTPEDIIWEDVEEDKIDIESDQVVSAEQFDTGTPEEEVNEGNAESDQ